MAPDTKDWAHLGALGAYFPLSAPRVRACNDYPEIAPVAPNAPTGCELAHDWTATHPRRPRLVGAVLSCQSATEKSRLAGNKSAFIASNSVRSTIWKSARPLIKPDFI